MKIPMIDTCRSLAGVIPNRQSVALVATRWARSGPSWLAGVMMVALVSVAAPLRAALFVVTGPGAVPVALVEEQIFPASFAGLPVAYGLDYRFRVLNISPGLLPINGFSVFTGAQAGLAQQFGSLNFVHVPAGFGIQFGPVGNPFIPFLTAEGNTFSPVPWFFTEFDQRPAPIAGYFVRWAQVFAGFDLPVGLWTQFDLFSTNPPVSGGGAVDLPGPGGFGVDFGGTSPFTVNFTFPEQVSIQQDGPVPSDDRFGTSNAFGRGGNYDGAFAAIPEPGSIVLFASGLLMLIVRRCRFTAKQTSSRLIRTY